MSISTIRIAAVIGTILLMARIPADAHHAFAAEFDSGKPVVLSGTVRNVEWLNPHAHFYIIVKDASGGSTRWELELASPNVLLRQGWTRYSLKEGDVVTVNGYLARDGSRLAAARMVRFTDNRTVFFSDNGDGGPPK